VCNTPLFSWLEGTLVLDQGQEGALRLIDARTNKLMIYI
jgi:hypothetical protein